jgi:two-component sensor histidine kinase
MLLEPQKIELASKLESYDFEMFSPQGNEACRNLVRKISDKIGGKNRFDKADVIQLFRDGVKKIAETHSEVYDTEPTWHISDLITQVCSEVGYNFQIERWDLM